MRQDFITCRATSTYRYFTNSRYLQHLQRSQQHLQGSQTLKAKVILCKMLTHGRKQQHLQRSQQHLISLYRQHLQGSQQRSRRPPRR